MDRELVMCAVAGDSGTCGGLCASWKGDMVANGWERWLDGSGQGSSGLFATSW